MATANGVWGLEASAFAKATARQGRLGSGLRAGIAPSVQPPSFRLRQGYWRTATRRDRSEKFQAQPTLCSPVFAQIHRYSPIFTHSEKKICANRTVPDGVLAYGHPSRSERDYGATGRGEEHR